MGFAKGGTAVVVGGASIAGFFAAACSLPFDYVKTQMQKMKPDPVTGELPFSVSGPAARSESGQGQAGAEQAHGRPSATECRHLQPRHARAQPGSAFCMHSLACSIAADCWNVARM